MGKTLRQLNIDLNYGFDAMARRGSMVVISKGFTGLRPYGDPKLYRN